MCCIRISRCGSRWDIFSKPQHSLWELWTPHVDLAPNLAQGQPFRAKNKWDPVGWAWLNPLSFKKNYLQFRIVVWQSHFYNFKTPSNHYGIHFFCTYATFSFIRSSRHLFLPDTFQFVLQKIFLLYWFMPLKVTLAYRFSFGILVFMMGTI